MRKSISREEIGSAFRCSSALHAVGDSYLLLTRPSPQLPTLELRFQFRYSAPEPPRLLKLDPHTLWFASTASPPSLPLLPRHKVEPADVTHALQNHNGQLRYSELRQQIMQHTDCFQAHCATGHQPSLSARQHHPQRRPVPLAAVAFLSLRLGRAAANPALRGAGSRGWGDGSAHRSIVLSQSPSQFYSAWGSSLARKKLGQLPELWPRSHYNNATTAATRFRSRPPHCLLLCLE